MGKFLKDRAIKLRRAAATGKKARITTWLTAKFLSDLGSTGNALDLSEETMKLDPIEQREVRYHILAYLCDNPNAGDSFDGIVEWWLLHQKIKFETRNISEAVRRLVAEGLIVES